MQAIKVLQEFPRFMFELVDLGDDAALDRLFDSYKFHTVIHFAGVAYNGESIVKPELYRLNNTENTWRLTDTKIRHNVPTLVYSSTCAVYGEPKEFPVTEDTPKVPVSPYGQSKWDAEHYLRYKVSQNFNAKVLRYFNVVGSDSKGRLRENPPRSVIQFGRLLTACLEVIFKRRPCVTLNDSTLDTPDGTAIRDYIHVEDIVQAHVDILKPEHQTQHKPFEVWNVAVNQPVSAMQFVEAARRVTGVYIPICFANEKARNSSPKIYASGEYLRSTTNWRPKYTNIDDMLQTAWKTQETNKDD